MIDTPRKPTDADIVRAILAESLAQVESQKLITAAEIQEFVNKRLDEEFPKKDGSEHG